jgi:hypothetical protein
MKTQHLAIAAAAAWSFAALSYVLLESLSDQRSLMTMIFNAAVVIAGSLGIATLISVDNHVGGLGWMGKTGIAFVGIGVAISAVAWGAVNVYLLIQGVGYLLFGIKLLRTTTAPTVSTVIVAGAFFTAPVAFLLADAAQIGTPNEYGDRDAAFALGFVVGATFMAIGLIGWARWEQRTTQTVSSAHTTDTHP